MRRDAGAGTGCQSQPDADAVHPERSDAGVADLRIAETACSVRPALPKPVPVLRVVTAAPDGAEPLASAAAAPLRVRQAAVPAPASPREAPLRPARVPVRRQEPQLPGVLHVVGASQLRRRSRPRPLSCRVLQPLAAELPRRPPSGGGGWQPVLLPAQVQAQESRPPPLRAGAVTALPQVQSHVHASRAPTAL